MSFENHLKDLRKLESRVSKQEQELTEQALFLLASLKILKEVRQIFQTDISLGKRIHAPTSPEIRRMSNKKRLVHEIEGHIEELEKLYQTNKERNNKKRNEKL